MFGYVRPLRDELKCRDFDLYRAVYCGLCRCMRRRYGLLAPMFLNYDFTFLALLLEEAGGALHPPAGAGATPTPFLKKTMCQSSPALDTAADESVVLTWWQLRDRAADSGLWAASRPGSSPCCSPPPTERRPAAGRSLTGRCGRVWRSWPPGGGGVLLHGPGGGHLRGAAAGRGPPRTGDGSRDRVLGQLLYHLGRWIYLIDAQDDLEEDRESGNYNAVAARFGWEGDGEAMRRTLDHSLNLMASAAQLAGLRVPPAGD